jgi:cell division protein FtsL
LAIFFFHRLSRKFFDEFAANFITVLFAIHPYLIWASVEIRVYSTVILLSVLLLKFLAEGFFDEDIYSKDAKTQKKAQIFYVFTAIVALYTNYYLGFLLVGGFFALIVVRRFRAARNYFLQMLVVGVCILPLLWIIRQQFAMNTSGFTEIKSIGEGLQILWNHTFTLTFPIEAAPASEQSVFTVIRSWFLRFSAAAIVFFLIKDKFRAVKEKVLMFAAITAVVVAFLLVAYLLLGAEYIAFRHVAVLFVPLILFLGMLLTNVLPRKSLILFAIVLALLFPYSKIYKQYPNFSKRGDWARIAQYIKENEKPNQPIIVFKNYDALTLPFHYKGINQILPDEKFFAWDTEDSLSNENAFRNQIAFVISEIPPEAQEIWLATEEVCQTETTAAACRPLENFLEANYTVIETKDFYLERLRLLRKK